MKESTSHLNRPVRFRDQRSSTDRYDHDRSLASINCLPPATQGLIVKVGRSKHQVLLCHAAALPETRLNLAEWRHIARGWHKYLLLTASGSVGLYFRVISKAIIISIVNTLNAHKMLQILLVDWLLQRDVNLQEIHSQKKLEFAAWHSLLRPLFTLRPCGNQKRTGNNSQGPIMQIHNPKRTIDCEWLTADFHSKFIGTCRESINTGRKRSGGPTKTAPA